MDSRQGLGRHEKRRHLPVRHPDRSTQSESEGREQRVISIVISMCFEPLKWRLGICPLLSKTLAS